MARKKGSTAGKRIPENERTVVDEFDNCAEVELVFPEAPAAMAFLPAVPRAGELVTSSRWERWKVAGRFRVTEVEWLYEGRVPGRVRVHLETERRWLTMRAARTLR